MTLCTANIIFSLEQHIDYVNYNSSTCKYMKIDIFIHIIRLQKIRGVIFLGFTDCTYWNDGGLLSPMPPTLSGGTWTSPVPESVHCDWVSDVLFSAGTNYNINNSITSTDFHISIYISNPLQPCWNFHQNL